MGAEPDRREPGREGRLGTEALRSSGLWHTGGFGAQLGRQKKIEEDVGWSRFGTRTWETGVLYWESGGAAGLGDELQV